MFSTRDARACPPPHTHYHSFTHSRTQLPHPPTQFDGDMDDEVDEITSGVLAEIGIEIQHALPSAPRGPTKSKAAVRQTTGDKATDALLAELGI